MTHPPIKAPFELPQTEAGTSGEQELAFANYEDMIRRQACGDRSEQAVAKARAKLIATLSHPAAQAGAVQAEQDLAAIYDAFRIGSAARSFYILKVNLSNVLRRSECLSAIERTFFMIPTEPEEEDDGVWGEECLLNWGQDPAEYVRTFREALKTISAVEGQSVFLVATGETHDGQETYTRHDARPPLCDAETLYTAPLAATQPSAAPGEGQGLQLIGWEYRHLDTANTPNRWSEWERCRARNRHTSTDEDFAQEIRAYIKSGFNYEVREIYAAAPGTAIAAREQESKAQTAINAITALAPKKEDSIHGPRYRCQQCEYAWMALDGTEGHAMNCAYVIATSVPHTPVASPAAAPTSQREKFMEVQPDGTTTEVEPDDCCRVNTFKSSICAHGTKGCDLLHPSPTSQPNAAAQEQQAPLSTMQIAGCASAVRPYSTALLTVPADELVAFVRNVEDAHGIAPAPTGMGSVGLPSGRGEEQS